MATNSVANATCYMARGNRECHTNPVLILKELGDWRGKYAWNKNRTASHSLARDVNSSTRKDDEFSCRWRQIGWYQLRGKASFLSKLRLSRVPKEMQEFSQVKDEWREEELPGRGSERGQRSEAGSSSVRESGEKGSCVSMLSQRREKGRCKEWKAQTTRGLGGQVSVDPNDLL